MLPLCPDTGTLPMSNGAAYYTGMSAGTKPNRIAIMFEYATLNGGERSMLACLDWLQRNETGWEFVAIAPGRGRLAEALENQHIDLIPWSMSDDRDRPRWSHEAIEASLIEAVHCANARLLHANSLAMGRIAGRLAGRLMIPTTSHLRDILKLSKASISDLNRNHRLIAVSDATREFHLAQGLDADRVVVVRNGLDLERFQPRPATGWLHDELKLPRSVKLLATIGQIGLRKGQDVLAAAAPVIVRKHSDVHFVLVGERTSTKSESIVFERAIIDRFAEQGLAGRLHRLGSRDDVPSLLTEITLLVHPAHQEPFGRVLLEAAACGVPVVATNVGGTSEIVVDGETGRLVPPRDPHALALAVNELLADETARHRTSLAARSRAVREFDISRAAQLLADQWQNVLG